MLKSGSVFPAALGHGAINAYVGFGSMIAPNADEIMTIPFGIPGILALLVLAIPFILDILKMQPRRNGGGTITIETSIA